MAFLVGGRVPLTIDGGSYAGVSCEVDSINSAPIQFAVLAKAAALAVADDGSASVAALRDLYDFFCRVGRPVWNLVDPIGPIPATADGMMRAPTDLVLDLINQWTETLPEPNPVLADIEKREAAVARTRK